MAREDFGGGIEGLHSTGHTRVHHGVEEGLADLAREPFRHLGDVSEISERPRVAVEKPVPVIVTAVPPASGPAAGLTAVTVGAAR